MEWLGIKCTVNTVKNGTNYALLLITLTIREGKFGCEDDFGVSIGFLSV